VRASDVSLGTHTYRIKITLSQFKMEVFDAGNLWIDTQVVIGLPGSPTPVGTFYLAEKLATAEHTDIPYGSYGSWVFPTNGYSEAMDEFDGGLPVIALHGTLNPASIGAAHSNGCIRIPNDLIVQMAEKLPAGTPIEILP
jgi:lipoprotein-anchoring transpeptidase ErfK/SrfK